MKKVSPVIQAITAMREQNIGRLLQRAMRDFSKRAIGHLQEYGYTDLTPFQAEAISYISLEGTYITELAKRLGTTKQTAGEVVSHLEKQGYIQRASDKNDKRATIIMFTSKGKEFLRIAYEVKIRIEQEYVTLLGKNKFVELIILLKTISNNS